MNTAPLPARARLQIAGVSEKGLRAQNEDSTIRFTSPLGEVIVVADGMGGHGHGDLASALVVNCFLEALTEKLKPETTPAQALAGACSLAHARIHETAAGLETRNGRSMGSTVVAAILRDTGMYVGHVGDSRAYLFRDGSLRQLTRDHSIVQREIDEGLITSEQARHDERASILTRALGMPDAVEIEVQGPIELKEGDGVLLSSDGLHGFVPQTHLELTMLHNIRDPQKVAQALVNLATGVFFSNDNVTVQFVQVGKPQVGGPPPMVHGRARRRAGVPHWVLALIWLAIGAAFAILASEGYRRLYAPVNRPPALNQQP